MNELIEKLKKIVEQHLEGHPEISYEIRYDLRYSDYYDVCLTTKDKWGKEHHAIFSIKDDKLPTMPDCKIERIVQLNVDDLTHYIHCINSQKHENDHVFFLDAEEY